MRVRIKYECVDKHTGKRYKKGQKITVTKDRGAELIEAGHTGIAPKKRRKPQGAPENKMAGTAPEDKG